MEQYSLKILPKVGCFQDYVHEIILHDTAALLILKNMIPLCGAGPVCRCDPNLPVIIVPADGLEPIGARSSAVMITKTLFFLVMNFKLFISNFKLCFVVQMTLG